MGSSGVMILPAESTPIERPSEEFPMTVLLRLF